MNDNAEPLGLGVGVAGGVSAGAAVGTVAGPVGAVIGAFVGGVAGGFAGVSAAGALTAPTYLTTAEAAERLHITREAVCRLIRRKQLPASRPRGAAGYRVTAADLEAFLQQRAAEGRHSA